MLLDVALIVAGIGLLYGGGELLVGGARSLARALGVAPLVVGLTVVAFGTSSPELAATLAASLQGAPQVALGNVLGSNIANLGLILGASALVAALVARAAFLRREIPFMVLTSALVLPLAGDGVFGRWDGLLLVALLVVYLVVLVVESRRAGPPAASATADGLPGGPTWRPAVSLLAVAAGVLLLAGGAQLLVAGAVGIARGAGVPERVVGVSLVALGTSLPELASCLVAARRHEGDIVLGNLVGSNVFNVLGILGTAALVRPLPVAPREFLPDYLVMLAFSVAVVPLLTLRGRLGRWEGGLLVAGYLAYIVWLYA